jgi:hypothetical protein
MDVAKAFIKDMRAFFVEPFWLACVPPLSR